jgi:formylmethanofuran dehydrogenase subunit D
VPKVKLNLISGRTIQQGVSMEGGKEKPAYRDACGIIEMDPSDIKKMGTWANTNVRVTSAHGSVIVKAINATMGPHPGLAFIPMGPWANSVVNPNTYAMGMPTFKGVPIEVEPAEMEKVDLAVDLVRKKVRGEA